MKVKTSRQMAKFLKDNIKLKCIENISFGTLTAHNYSALTYINANPDLDFLDNSGMYGVIVIEYKPECYAPNLYLTTTDLIRCYKSSSGTAKSFLNEVKDEIAI